MRGTKKHTRFEWSVEKTLIIQRFLETMHWLPDVHFGEDDCRIQNESVQKNLNIIRKIVINSFRLYKDKTASKRPFSSLMLECLIDPSFVHAVLFYQN